MKKRLLILERLTTKKGFQLTFPPTKSSCCVNNFQQKRKVCRQLKVNLKVNRFNPKTLFQFSKRFSFLFSLLTLLVV